jgi:hypothetical protein
LTDAVSTVEDMHIEISSVLIEDHLRRLSEAAQTPTMPFVARVWARVMRRTEPVVPVKLPVREVERLAA